MMKINTQYRSAAAAVCLLLFIQCRCMRLDDASHHVGVLAEENNNAHTSRNANATSLQPPGNAAAKARLSAKEQERASVMGREGTTTNSEYTVAIDEEYLKASIRTIIAQHGKEWLGTSIRSAVEQREEWLGKHICAAVNANREEYKEEKEKRKELEERISKDCASIETLKVKMDSALEKYLKTDGDDRETKGGEYADEHYDYEAQVKQYEKDIAQGRIQVDKFKESLPRLEVQISFLETLHEALKISNIQLRTPTTTTSGEVSDESVLSAGTAKPYLYHQ